MSRGPMYLSPGQRETVFSVGSTPIKFGPDALNDLGADAQPLGIKRVALFVDAHMLNSAPGATALAALRGAMDALR